MRDNRIHYVLVGSFVLAMLVVLVVSIALLSGRTGRSDPYFATYDNVSGLRYGTRVLFEGYPVGQVEDIRPLADQGRTRFRVRLSVARGWPIPEDSVARIAASGLLSAVVIDIRSGTSGRGLEPGADLKSLGGGNLYNAMADIAAEVTALSQTGLRPLLETLNRMVATFAPLLEQRAPQILDNLMALSADLAGKGPRITANVEDMTAGMTKLLSPDNTRKMEEVIANAQRTSANLAELSGSLRTSKAKVDALLSSLDKLAADNGETVNGGLKDLRYSLQAVARTIDSITYNLEGAARNVNEFSREIRQEPSLLLWTGRPRDEGGAK
jgi:phospholipid/cholesterol/gamma-HCH transport system substrate-binding protein